MSKVLVLGASGQIARHAISMLAEQGHELTLFARQASRVNAPAGARVLEGDVLDPQALETALEGQDLVYANLAGEIGDQAEALVQAMQKMGQKKLIFVLSLGIYQELPEPFNTWNQEIIGEALVDYRRAADLIEASDLDYMILRPAWLTDKDETDYETTARTEQFKGTEVSRKAVAALITELVAQPEKYARTNLGVNKPGTDGPAPAWF